MQLIIPVNKLMVTVFFLFKGIAQSYRVYLAYNKDQKEKQSFGGSHLFLDFHRY